jgi:hypothetical protein
MENHQALTGRYIWEVPLMTIVFFVVTTVRRCFLLLPIPPLNPPQRDNAMERTAFGVVVKRNGDATNSKEINVS